MAKIQETRLRITAVNATSRAFNAVRMGLAGLRKAVFSLRAGLISTAGIAGMGFLIKKSMDLTDELGKSSRAIGVSVEALQRLRHAANLGGMASKVLDKAVQKLAINIAEVATGTGEAKDAFEKYGITATNADGSLRSVGSVMDEVAEVMQGMTNQTERAALAYDLFGARGAKMVNVLKDGKTGLHAAMLEADELGLVMSEKTVKGVEAANDALTRLGSYIAGVFNRVVAEMAPFIKAVTDNIRQWITLKIDDAGGMVGVAKKVSDSLEVVYQTAVKTTRVIGNVIDVFQQWSATTGSIDSLTAIDNAMAKVSDRISGIYDLRSQGRISLRVMEYQLERLTAHWEQLALAREKLQKNPVEITYNATAVVKEIKEIPTLEIKTVNLIPDQLADAAYQEYLENLVATAKMVSEVREANHQASMAVKSDWQLAGEAIGEAFRGVKDSVADTLTDALMGTQSWGDAMRSILRDIQRQLIRNTIVNPFVNAISTALPSPFAGARANGGPVASGSTYLVGERGPELFTPKSSGQIVPNEAMGQPVNVTFNINAIDTQSATQVIASQRGAIMGVINQALNDSGRPALT